MRKLLLALPLLLSACGVAVDLSTASELAAVEAEIVPRVQTATTIRAFDKYCARNPGNPGRTVTLLKQDGYKLLVTSRRNKMFGYAHPSRPFVAVIDNQFEPGCMVMVQRDPQVARAFDRFVNSRHRDAIDGGRNQGLDRAWIVTGQPDRIYSRKLDGTDEVLLLITR